MASTTTAVQRMIREGGAGLKRRLIGIYAFLLAFNVIIWVLTLGAASKYATLLSTGVLAYTFGLRHAVDADHIAAIDNTTRKLMQDGQRPVGVGLFFSLGHSTVVVSLSVILAIATSYAQANIAGWKAIGGVIGTSVSGVFLLIIGIINLIVLIDIYKMWRQVRQGGDYSDATLEEFLSKRGLIARMLRPLLKIVDHSWKMYPIGILFGLGFDTASEVGLLGLSSVSAANHMPIAYILLLPLLFMAGMSLIDTTDGVLMLGAYGWAYIKPIRKLYYNMNITLVSVLIALGIGGIEALQVISGELNLSGPFWGFIKNNLDFGVLGYYIVGIFLLSWGVSTLVYKFRRYDSLGVEAEAS